MGLAASQARFLAITARKADCEYRSMELSEEQLSLSRELEAATEDYENSINATKLVWDLDGSGDFMYDLTYNTMMYPSEANKYTPYMLARTDGKLAMNDKFTSSMYNAIKDVLGEDAVKEMFTDDGQTFKGLCDYTDSANNKKVQVSDAQKNMIYLKYLEELQKTNAISTTNAVAASGTGLLTNAGLGGDLMGRETANQMYLSTMLNYIDMLVANAASGYYPPNSSEAALADDLTFCFDYSAYNKENKLTHENTTSGSTLEIIPGKAIKSIDPGFVNKSDAATIMINGSYSSNTTYTTNSDGKYVGSSTTGAFTLADLLDEDVSLVVTGPGSTTFNKVLDNITNAINVGNGQGSSAFTLIINKDLTEWYDEVAGKGALASLQKDELAVVTYIDQLAKAMWGLLMPEEPTDTDLNAFYTSMSDLISRFRISTSSDGYVDLGGKGSTEGNAKTAASYSTKYNCWVKKGNQWAINLSNMAETFLTNFCNGMDGYTNDFGIFQKVNASYYVTDEADYIYTINSGETVDEDMWCSEFYSIIFNTLCQNGSYVNNQLDDSEYLQNAIKNGQLFVVSQGSDNYFYQSRYAQISGDHIVEVSDTDAIAQAEREYTIAKSKINVKEEKVQLELKRVDAELSSLNTEYDTVKSLISTNVQKVFSLFQSS